MILILIMMVIMIMSIMMMIISMMMMMIISNKYSEVMLIKMYLMVVSFIHLFLCCRVLIYLNILLQQIKVTIISFFSPKVNFTLSTPIQCLTPHIHTHSPWMSLVMMEGGIFYMSDAYDFLYQSGNRSMLVCLYGWMDGWMHVWMDGWMDEW